MGEFGIFLLIALGIIVMVIVAAGVVVVAYLYITTGKPEVVRICFTPDMDLHERMERIDRETDLLKQRGQVTITDSYLLRDGDLIAREPRSYRDFARADGYVIEYFIRKNKEAGHGP